MAENKALTKNFPIKVTHNKMFAFSENKKKILNIKNTMVQTIYVFKHI